MPIQPYSLQQSNLRLLWSGVLTVGILCLLAAWSFGSHAEYVDSNTGHGRFAVSVDMPLHASSEHTLSLQRFFNRYKDQPKPVEPAEPIWALTAGEYIVSLPFVARNQQNLAAHSPHIHLHQLQTLNVPRAPPLV